jgi:HK97 family phage portal protein
MSVFGGSIFNTEIVKSIDDADWGWTEVGTPGAVSIRSASAISRSLSPSDAYALAIGVRRAVTAITNNVVQARPRLFTRGGREIVGGAPFDFIQRPYPRMTWARWAREWVQNWLVWGEHAAWKRRDSRGMMLELLSPPRLSIDKPKGGLVDSREDVSAWEYSYPSGKRVTIPDVDLVFDRMPGGSDPVRGLSPLVTGATQAGISHFAGLYNQAFFQNDTVPRGMMKVPNMGQSRLEDFERQFRERFSSNGSNRVNYHKIMFAVTNGDVEWIPFEQQPDGTFLETQKWAFELVGSLYGVPPVEMQNLQKTRFDTADVERKLFAESTIMPLLEQLTGELQIQVIEPWFAGERVVTTNPAMSKGMRSAFERARTVAAGDIVLLLDPDTMPVMASVKAGLIDLAQKFRTSLGASPQETIEFFGIDLPAREERLDVYMPKTEWNVTRPEKNPEVQIAEQANQRHAADAANASTGSEDEPPPAPAASPPANDKTALRSVGRLVRGLRVMTLERLFPRGGGDGELWSLGDADAINELGEEGARMIRRIRFAVRGIQRNHPKEEWRDRIREYFGSIDLKKLLERPV